MNSLKAAQHIEAEEQLTLHIPVIAVRSFALAGDDANPRRKLRLLRRASPSARAPCWRWSGATWRSGVGCGSRTEIQQAAQVQNLLLDRLSPSSMTPARVAVSNEPTCWVRTAARWDHFVVMRELVEGERRLEQVVGHARARELESEARGRRDPPADTGFPVRRPG
ncbi:MAG: hypothetical protein IPI73_07530 [Betaproteobacteria bacterium]|nr:hypothetical protein [Betaproteobacteria bacterium]